MNDDIKYKIDAEIGKDKEVLKQRKQIDKLIEENVKLETICRELGHEVSDLRKKKYEKYYVPTIENQKQEIERLNKQLQLISDEFLKYDWENSSKKQIINQLKSLYNSIFKGSESNE